METSFEFKFVKSSTGQVFITAIRYSDPDQPFYRFKIGDQQISDHPKLAKQMSKEKIDIVGGSATGGTFRVNPKSGELNIYTTTAGRFWFKGEVLERESKLKPFVSGTDPAVFLAEFHKQHKRTAEAARFESLLQLVPAEDEYRFRAQSYIWTFDELVQGFTNHYKPLFDREVADAIDSKMNENGLLENFFSRKVDAYQSTGMQWSAIIMLLRTRDVQDEEIKQLLDKWSPVNKADLLVKAARYDQAKEIIASGRLQVEEESEHEDEDPAVEHQENNEENVELGRNASANSVLSTFGLFCNSDANVEIIEEVSPGNANCNFEFRNELRKGITTNLFFSPISYRSPRADAVWQSSGHPVGHPSGETSRQPNEQW